MIDTSGYIHLNPVKSNYTKLPEDYRWSSYKSFITMGANRIVDTQKLHQYMGENPHEKYKFYINTKLNTRDWNMS